MVKPINMPQVGQDLETAIISEWCIEENDKVEKGDVIAVVESDKASFDVEAFDSGTILKLLFDEGDEAAVFKPIAYYGDPGDIVDEAPNTENSTGLISKSTDSQVEVNAQTETITKAILATPVVKRIAKEHNIDILSVSGSGPNGRILKEDILKFAEIDLNGSQESNGVSSCSQSGDQRIEYSKMRQKIANRLVESKQQIPHFYLFMDVDVTELILWRQEKNKVVDNGDKISINDILILAVAKTLKKFPQLNTHVSQSHLVLKSDINIGIAVSLEDGLIVPVLEHADEKEIEKISVESREIIESARKGKLKSNAQGTFTISNLGMYPINKFIPIINTPEAVILGVGKAEKKVVPTESAGFGVKDILTLTLACDHRAVDGALGSQFLEELKSCLENIERIGLDKKTN